MGYVTQARVTFLPVSVATTFLIPTPLQITQVTLSNSHTKQESNVKIETGIPMPEVGRRKKYQFAEMNVGDSILSDENARLAAAQRKAKYPGWDYASEKQPDGTIRIWRTA
jgi:hypothetical protein